MLKILSRLPWFAYLFFALISLAVGAYYYQNATTMNAHRATALAGEIPELIDVSNVTESSFSAAKEIHVSSQISGDIFTVSVSGRRTVDESKTTIFALPADATNNSDTINVVYMFDSYRSVDKFIDTFATEENGDMSIILNVNGAAYSPGRKLISSVRKAADQAGLNLSRDAVYVEPFTQGRTQGLKMEHPMIYFGISAVIAGILALISLIKVLLNVRRKKKMAAHTDQIQTTDA